MAESSGNVLIVAGSDSGGGAGIQADIKTVTALGGYAATAVTALTAQNTRGVHGVLGIDPGFVRQQMRVVLEDIAINAIKTGMLHDGPVIAAVAEVVMAGDLIARDQQQHTHKVEKIWSKLPGCVGVEVFLPGGLLRHGGRGR